MAFRLLVACLAHFVLSTAYPMHSIPLPLGCATEVSRELRWAHRHRNLVTGLALVLVSWCLYLPSLWHGFVYFDDVRLLRDHPELYGQPTLGQDLKGIFVTCFPREEPLLFRDVAWAIVSRFFGFGNPFGYHLLNVLLHGVVVGLVFLFLLQTTRVYRLALSATVGWLLLAVHTEPLSWIMGSKDILSTLFMVLALCAQTRRLDSTNGSRWWWWYIATIGLVAGGLLSKVSVLTFPLVLLLHAVLLPYVRGECPSRASLPSFRVLARESALALPAFLASGVTYLWYSRTLSQMGIFDRADNTRRLEHFWNVLVLDPLALWVYLKQLFFPSSLSVLYTWPVGRSVYPFWQIAIALTTVALVAMVGVWLFLRRKDLFLYFAAFFVLMVPYMNLTYSGFLVADRYIYFASLFAVLLALSLAIEWLRQPAAAPRTAVLILAAVIGGNNLFQKLSYQPAWHNAETLWQYHLTLPRPSAESFANLAAYYYAQATAAQNPAEADQAIHKMAVVLEGGLHQLWPDRSAQPATEIWNLLFLQSIHQEVTGSPQKALASLLLADQLHPRFDSINLNLARLYLRLAQAEANRAQTREYARNARDRFATYIEVEFRGRTPPPDVLNEKAGIEAAYRSIAVEPTDPTSKLSGDMAR
jgi:protein O-mannosyl-transferase